MIVLKTSHQLEIMREACRLSALALKLGGEAVVPGVTTGEIDALIKEFITKQGAKPTFLHYNGFPASACISVNEELIHGIPGNRKIRNGDIVTIDVGAAYGGYNGDNAATFAAGDISDETRRLLDVTEKSLYKGIEKAKAGNRIGDVGSAVQTYVESNGYSVVKRYVGHGVGEHLHEEPDVPNYGRAGRGTRLVPGMTIAIEPMVNAGTPEVKVLSNGWTVITADRKMCAHFEHTVAITDSEPVILTLP